MRSIARVAIVSVALLVLFAEDVRAQGGTPNQPPPDVGTPNQPPPDVGTPVQPPPGPPADPPPPKPPQDVAPAPAAAVAAPPSDVEHGDLGRLRLGFNVNGGLGSGNDLTGPFLGVTIRAGWQLNHLMGIYGQGSAFGWIAASPKTVQGQTLDIGVIGGQQLTPMFSLTPLDLIENAAGPSADRLTGGSSSSSIVNGVVTTAVKGYSGFYFGVHGRVAIHIGGKPNGTTGRRVSFTIGADIHPTFAEGNTLTFYTLGLGADWY